MYQRIGHFKVTREVLPGGDRGTFATLDIMKRLASEGARQLPVREAAVTAVRAFGAQPHDHLSQLRAIYTFVRDQITFVNDTLGAEWLQSPRHTLAIRAGDCDDRSTLIVAMARSIGIPAQLFFRVIGADRRSPGRFSHVYVVAKLKGRRISLDPTYQSNQFGFEFSRPSRFAEVPA